MVAALNGMLALLAFVFGRMRLVMLGLSTILVLKMAAASAMDRLAPLPQDAPAIVSIR